MLSTFRHVFAYRLTRFPILLCAVAALPLLLAVPSTFAQVPPQAVTADYPPDPRDDIPWLGSYNSLADVQQAFNSARSRENSQLGTFLKEMTLPPATTWAGMDDGAKALWLINAERTARGLMPLQATESNARTVAQAFAQYLLEQDAFDHNADGNTPWDRLHANAAIGACHDTLGVAENLYWQGTTSPDPIPFIVEQAIYDWLYADKISKWGHRHALLWTAFTDNATPTGSEGFIGVGRARGAFTDPYSQRTFPNTEMIVLDLFDPCATWQSTAPAPVTPPPAPVVTPPPAKPQTYSASGVARLPTWVTISQESFEVDTWPTSKWIPSDSNGSTNGEYHWIAAACRVYAGTYSAMAAGGGADGRQKACGDDYPNNVRSWLMYGPFSLADAIAAELRAKVWVYTEPNNDMLCLMASTDGKGFNGPCVSGYSDGWVEELFDLNDVYNTGSLLGRTGLYVALIFVTNESETRPHMGVYADDVVLQKAVLSAPTAAGGATADATGLYGVHFVDGAGNVVTSDADGAFTVPNLTAGTHVLTPQREGYQFYPPSITVDVSKGNVTGLSFVGTTSLHYKVNLPLLRQPAGRAAAATVQRTDASFTLECSESGCQMLGPLP